MPDSAIPRETLPPNQTRRACGHVVTVAPGKGLSRRLFDAVAEHLDNCPVWRSMAPAAKAPRPKAPGGGHA